MSTTLMLGFVEISWEELESEVIAGAGKQVSQPELL
jgi:hypothetical protein